MQNKTLLTILAALCALLIFETGYLIGIGEQRKIYRALVNRYWGCTEPKMLREARPLQVKKKGFFVAAMTSRETDQAKIITVNLPGVEKKNISIEVNGRYLTIQARQKKSDFSQTITLDDNARIHQIKAEFRKDTLTITVPKDKRFRELPEKAFAVPMK